MTSGCPGLGSQGPACPGGEKAAPISPGRNCLGKPGLSPAGLGDPGDMPASTLAQAISQIIYHSFVIRDFANRPTGQPALGICRFSAASQTRPGRRPRPPFPRLGTLIRFQILDVVLCTVKRSFEKNSSRPSDERTCRPAFLDRATAAGHHFPGRAGLAGNTDCRFQILVSAI